MNINRHNYEEYFILYMDNELSSDDRRLVEAFVQQHPDLKEELDILLQYKLSPDASVVFQGKEELMKVNGDTPVTPANYEEWLVLYADNELSAAQRRVVDQFIEATPAAKQELNLLMKAKLQPEEIVFAGKDSLYRTEERVRRVPVWRIAAAAILILAVSTAALFVFNGKSSGGNTGVARSNPASNKKTAPVNINPPKNGENDNIIPEITNPGNKEVLVSNNPKESVSPSVKKDNKNIAVKNNKPVINNKVSPKNPIPLKKQEETFAEKKLNPSNNLPEPLNNPAINKTSTNNDALAKNIPPNEITAPIKTDVTNVVPAAYNNSGGQLEEGGNNKKSRGLFRKIARTFEKRTNINATDDDRLLVAGLSIKLK